MENLLVLAPELSSWAIGLIIFGAFVVLVVIIFIVTKLVKPLQIKKDNLTEEEVAKEELDRVLVPIEDEGIQKQMNEDANKNEK